MYDTLYTIEILDHLDKSRIVTGLKILKQYLNPALTLNLTTIQKLINSKELVLKDIFEQDLNKITEFFVVNAIPQEKSENQTYYEKLELESKEIDEWFKTLSNYDQKMVQRCIKNSIPRA